MFQHLPHVRTLRTPVACSQGQQAIATQVNSQRLQSVSSQVSSHSQQCFSSQNIPVTQQRLTTDIKKQDLQSDTAHEASINEKQLCIIDQDDSENEEEFQRAIRASLISLESNVDKVPMEHVLKTWIGCTVTVCEDEQELIIHRRRIFESTQRAVSRVGFTFEKPFKVQFSGEMGEDFGGPKREFLSILMTEIDRLLFEGEIGHKTFIHSVAKLEKNMFLFGGKMVAWSVLHSGPSLPIFSESYFRLIMGQNISLSIDDVPDYEIRKKIEMIKDAPEKELIDSSDWFIDAGVGAVLLPVTEEKRKEMMVQLVKHFAYLRTHAESAQFLKGLNCVGSFCDVLRNNLEEFIVLFTPSKEKLTIKKLKTGVAEISLNEVLMFWTGSSDIPPLGFHKSSEINFVANNQKKNKLPVAHTCDMSLELPREVEDPSEMSRLMFLAVRWGAEFHLA